jgi:hypothetical protein
MNGQFFKPQIDLSEFRSEDGQLHGTLLGLPTDKAGLARLQRKHEEFLVDCDTRWRIKVQDLGHANLFPHLFGGAP